MPLEKDKAGSRISALGHERLAIVGVMDDPQTKEIMKDGPALCGWVGGWVGGWVVVCVCVRVRVRVRVYCSDTYIVIVYIVIIYRYSICIYVLYMI